MTLSMTQTAAAKPAVERGARFGISAAALAGVLIAAPFLHPAFFLLAWIAFVPLYWAVVRARRPREAFLIAWLAGAIAHVMGFYWVEHAGRVFGGIPFGLSEIVLLGFAALNSLHIALFGLLIFFCGIGPLALIPALPRPVPRQGSRGSAAR